MIDPAELARLLEIPEPTGEQRRVIEGPLAPMAVVAGAGSGKSETMASRVVWLVANGFVRPERVLGLTFTRKAAAELGSRVRRRLDQLREKLPPEDLERLGGEAVFDGEPTVSTYHSYAARLFGDHALREALEPTTRLITPAVAWQIASRVVDTYDGPMDLVDRTPDTVIDMVMDLAGELAEHLRGPADVRGVGETLRRMYAAVAKPLKPMRDVLATQALREQLLPLVEAYSAAKGRREVVDHGDQMALAARIAARHPEVGLIERNRYSVVLLDEYQDTSHAQLVLLQSLFGGGHPVTAVGDPCQSIYGWRGASAGNLLRFPQDFPVAPGQAAPMNQLSQSFRNGQVVLDAAAAVQRELRADMASVPRLVPGAPRQGRGRVEAGLFHTVEDEADWIADRLSWMLRDQGAPDGGDPEQRLSFSDVAVLARKRSQFAMIRRALEERGIPVEVVGLGGLLTVPEVQDVVATLRVVHDPSAGTALARLLTGPRWRIGPRDLVLLGRRARDLARSSARDVVQVPAAAEPERAEADPLRAMVDELAAETGSLVDALDDLGDPSGYSPEGFRRMHRLRDELRGLRTQVGLPLPDLVAEVERVLGLDIEVAARTGLDPATARADLDAFIDAAATFAGDAEDPTLGAFLAYLKAAESEEFGLEAGRVGQTDSVKLLTVHASKGLEWEVVVVPGLSYVPQRNGTPAKGSIFPSPPQKSSRWTANPRLLPYPLRGDARDLPHLAGLDKTDLADFDLACAERDVREERRLAYVAVTRARALLVATGYRWGSATRALEPSPFLAEVREAARVVCWVDPPADDAGNPLLEQARSAVWPTTPEGERQRAVTDGARLVRDAMTGHAKAAWVGIDGLSVTDRGRLTAWARDVELLLAERDKGRGDGGLTVELPSRLSVTSLVSLARDPQELARQIRRPMPRPPAPFARRGTSFHTWLESRWGQQRLLDLDDLMGAADEDAVDDVLLAELQQKFERSAWAGRVPTDVEVPFETIIGDRLVRGRMDAVFRTDDGGFEVVDWKTGSPPGRKEAAHAAVQLAAYRLAWSALRDVPAEQVSAAFHYVAAEVTVRPVDLLDARGLAALLETVPPG